MRLRDRPSRFSQQHYTAGLSPTVRPSCQDFAACRAYLAFRECPVFQEYLAFPVYRECPAFQEYLVFQDDAACPTLEGTSSPAHAPFRPDESGSDC